MGPPLQWLLLSKSTGSRTGGSGVVVHRPGCLIARGILLGQGLNHTPYVDRGVLNHWITREVLHWLYFIRGCIHSVTQSCLILCDPTRLLCPWDSPGKNTGVGCHALLQRIYRMLMFNSQLFSAVLKFMYD